MWVSNSIKVKMSRCKNQGKDQLNISIFISLDNILLLKIERDTITQGELQCFNNIWSWFDLHNKNVFAAVSCSFRDTVSLKFVRKKLATWQFTIRVIRDPFLDPLSWPQDPSAFKRLNMPQSPLTIGRCKHDVLIVSVNFKTDLLTGPNQIVNKQKRRYSSQFKHLKLKLLSFQTTNLKGQCHEIDIFVTQTPPWSNCICFFEPAFSAAPGLYIVLKTTCFSDLHSTYKFKVKYVKARLFARRIFCTVGSWLRCSGTPRRWCVRHQRLYSSAGQLWLGRGERDCVERGHLGSASGQRTSGFHTQAKRLKKYPHPVPYREEKEIFRVRLFCFSLN